MYLGKSLSGCVSTILRTGEYPAGPYVIVGCCRVESPVQAYDVYHDRFSFRDQPRVKVVGVLEAVWPHLILPRLMSEFSPDYVHYAGGDTWTEVDDSPESVWRRIDEDSVAAGYSRQYNTFLRQAQMDAAVMRAVRQTSNSGL